MQRVYRGYRGRLVAKEQERWMRSRDIQRVYRGWRGRVRFKRLWLEHWSAVAIQDWWKNRLSRALAKEILSFRRRTRPAATAFQKMWRGYVARHKVAAVREHFRVRAAATCYGAWEAAHTQKLYVQKCMMEQLYGKDVVQQMMEQQAEQMRQKEEEEALAWAMFQEHEAEQARKASLLEQARKAINGHGGVGGASEEAQEQLLKAKDDLKAEQEKTKKLEQENAQLKQLKQLKQRLSAWSLRSVIAFRFDS